jgi:hypothetical protein
VGGRLGRLTFALAAMTACTRAEQTPREPEARVASVPTPAAGTTMNAASEDAPVEQEHLFPASMDGKVGYIDRQGA